MKNVSTKIATGLSSVVLATALVAAPAAMAETPSKVRIFDHTKTIVTEVPVTQRRCNEVRVPVYGSVEVQGNAGSGALMGMIVGGLLGKGVTGDDGGAAAGAVMGGIIGANESGPRTERQVVGYETKQQCGDYTAVRSEKMEVYSHSTIRFFIDGQRYVLEFQR